MRDSQSYSRTPDQGRTGKGRYRNSSLDTMLDEISEDEDIVELKHNPKFRRYLRKLKKKGRLRGRDRSRSKNRSRSKSVQKKGGKTQVKAKVIKGRQGVSMVKSPSDTTIYHPALRKEIMPSPYNLGMPIPRPENLLIGENWENVTMQPMLPQVPRVINSTN